MQVFRPGASYTYHYSNNQDAAGLWYHDHALGITRLNVYAGLAGGYLLRDTPGPGGTGIDTGDGTHLPPPPYEVPLIIQDRMFNPDGSLAYPPNPDLLGADGNPRPWAPSSLATWPRSTANAGPTWRWPAANTASGSSTAPTPGSTTSSSSPAGLRWSSTRSVPTAGSLTPPSGSTGWSSVPVNGRTSCWTSQACRPGPGLSCATVPPFRILTGRYRCGGAASPFRTSCSSPSLHRPATRYPCLPA
ncbi:multicopper oxidase domain-containing protein [Arthrobacter nitrophenolicus]|uniref:multicopper oxidase domain-containing protein n=1 Tax=Arthrobacter nitrophenolicus TaxID=683150 RepID=UPI001F2B5F8A|nr:multicopper oxidase domain-containing protein [Arthrobacter nitrophenolicus]